MLEEKIDKLTDAITQLISTMSNGGGTPAATTAKATTGRKAADKSTHTAEQVKAKFAELKANDAVGIPPLKKIITDLGAKDLNDLLVTPKLFDKAMAAMEELENGLSSSSDLDDGDDL